MADGALARNSAQVAHDVMAGDAVWLIDDEKTVHLTTLDRLTTVSQ